MKIKEKSTDQLFAMAMAGIKKCYGQNAEARSAEIAVCEMHRRLKILDAVPLEELTARGLLNGDVITFKVTAK